jgi:hypothetical protein
LDFELSESAWNMFTYDQGCYAYLVELVEYFCNVDLETEGFQNNVDVLTFLHYTMFKPCPYLKE